MKKDCVSLQVHKPIHIPEKSRIPLFNVIIAYFRKRVCLFISSKSKYSGSVTIETLISLLVFMMIILFMSSFMIIINTEITMQMNIDNIARNTAKNMFYLEVADEITDYNKNLKDLKEQIQDKLNEKYVELPEEEINEGYLLARLIKNIGIKSFDNESFLCDIKGLSVSESSIENEKIDFVVKYKMKIPLVNKFISITQRSFVKDWTGRDITASNDVVYITESGEVYHRSKDCSHLIIHISKTTVGYAESGYNSKNYSECDYCVDGKLQSGDEVFVTKEGDKYHSSLRCRGLTRRIIESDINQIEGRRPCSECGQGV